MSKLWPSVAILICAACSADFPGAGGAGGAAGGGAGGAAGTGGTGGSGPYSKLDVLVMVDNSSSMITAQSNLAFNFPTFVNVLKALPGGLPDLHLAVITSDMGAALFTGSEPPGSSCNTEGTGAFVDQPIARAGEQECIDNALVPTNHFITSAQNGTVNNFTGSLSTVFSCLAEVSDQGCGFEQPLAAVRAALGDPTMGIDPPPQNGGFLRDDALLAILLITNEDDCSVPLASELFDPTQNSVDSELGFFTSFRCSEFGILCSGQKPPRAVTGPLVGCVSNDAAAQTDPTHSLVPVASYIDYFAGLKADPTTIYMATIAAPTEPFQVSYSSQRQVFVLDHSCDATDTGVFGDPAVRLKQVIDSFGARGSFSSVCNATYVSALQDIATQIGTRLAP